MPWNVRESGEGGSTTEASSEVSRILETFAGRARCVRRKLNPADLLCEKKVRALAPGMKASIFGLITSLQLGSVAGEKRFIALSSPYGPPR